MCTPFSLRPTALIQSLCLLLFLSHGVQAAEGPYRLNASLAVGSGFSGGYNVDGPGDLRVSFEFDYAGGDVDLFDRDSERFDSLFGPTTFEFGVVWLFDPFSRSNLRRALEYAV